MAGVDLGFEVVDSVRRRPQWAQIRCSRWPRGFACSPFGLRQRIWTGPGIDDDGRPAWRVQVRTSTLAGFDGSPAQCDALAADMAEGALAATVRDPDDRTRLQLASTVHVHRGHTLWATDVVALVARWQAAEARRLARSSPLLGLGAWPDRAAHPESDPPGERGEKRADTLSPPPAATAVRVWPVTDVRAAVDLLRARPGGHAISTPRGLMASFALVRPASPRRRIVLELDTLSLRPDLGRGLSLLLLLPGGDHAVQTALALNEAELAAESRSDLLGGWSVRDGLLRFSAFVPSSLHAPGLVLRLVLAAALRAERFL